MSLLVCYFLVCLFVCVFVCLCICLFVCLISLPLQDGEIPMTDWEKYATREYEDLIADEELNKQYEYEDDFEDEEEEMALSNVAKSAVETYAK